MVTVKDAVGVLKSADSIDIILQGKTYKITQKNESTLVSAFSDYVVESIQAKEKDTYEIRIAMKPVRKE